MVSSCGMSFNSLEECVDDGHALVLEGFFVWHISQYYMPKNSLVCLLRPYANLLKNN